MAVLGEWGVFPNVCDTLPLMLCVVLDTDSCQISGSACAPVRTCFMGAVC